MKVECLTIRSDSRTRLFVVSKLGMMRHHEELECIAKRYTGLGHSGKKYIWYSLVSDHREGADYQHMTVSV